MTLSRGSTAKLSCDARYDFQRCGVVHVVWCHEDHNKLEMTDPRRYLTTVSETVDGRMRLRRVVTEILELDLEDNGRFQCRAECESGDTAMGHFISIAVRGAE